MNGGKSWFYSNLKVFFRQIIEIKVDSLPCISIEIFERKKQIIIQMNSCFVLSMFILTSVLNVNIPISIEGGPLKGLLLERYLSFYYLAIRKKYKDRNQFIQIRNEHGTTNKQKLNYSTWREISWVLGLIDWVNDD